MLTGGRGGRPFGRSADARGGGGGGATSPTTGQGRNIMLMTQGKEEAMFKRSQGVVKSVQKVISAKNFVFYPHNPRMVPDAFTPTLNKVTTTPMSRACDPSDRSRPLASWASRPARARVGRGWTRQVNMTLPSPRAERHEQSAARRPAARTGPAA